MDIKNIFDSIIDTAAGGLAETVINDIIESTIGDAFLKLSVDESLAFKKKLEESIKDHLHAGASREIVSEEFVTDEPFGESDYFANVTNTDIYSLANDDPDISNGRLIGVRKTIKYLRHNQ